MRLATPILTSIMAVAATIAPGRIEANPLKSLYTTIDLNACLVAAAHAAGETAGKHQAEGGGDWSVSHFYERTSLIMDRRLAPVLGAFLLDRGEVLVEHDAIFARERDEAFAASAPDQRQVGLVRQFDAPGSETGA